MINRARSVGAAYSRAVRAVRMQVQVSASHGSIWSRTLALPGSDSEVAQASTTSAAGTFRGSSSWSPVVAGRMVAGWTMNAPEICGCGQGNEVVDEDQSDKSSLSFGAPCIPSVACAGDMEYTMR